MQPPGPASHATAQTARRTPATPRKKKAPGHKRGSAAAEDKRLQAILKRLGVNAIPGVEGVDIVLRDSVIQFTKPKRACVRRPGCMQARGLGTTEEAPVPHAGAACLCRCRTRTLPSGRRSALAPRRAPAAEHSSAQARPRLLFLIACARSAGVAVGKHLCCHRPRDNQDPCW